ncbi:MAG: hypothetical protein KBD14_01610 [Candidatus Pacebacteria bacterium]|nr:hypothetical protein [Candidatus Paceibacterota bacterium]
MATLENRLRGLKVVGHVDLTQFTKETKVPKPTSEKPAKRETTLPPKKPNNRNTIGNAILLQLGGSLELDFTEDIYQTIHVKVR